LSMLASAIFIFLGAARYRLDRHHRAYRFFEQALLINILVGQVILFFKNSTIAIAGLAITLFLLINLQILDTARKRRQSA
jgi:diacylglycerol kinase